jgi:Cu/Ag efflux pump CusA
VLNPPFDESSTIQRTKSSFLTERRSSLVIENGRHLVWEAEAQAKDSRLEIRHLSFTTNLLCYSLYFHFFYEVNSPLFFSLLIITLSFLPVLTLEGQEARLFAPLAFTMTYAMAAAAGLSVTLVPALMAYLIRGRVRPEEQNPINRGLIDAYRPLIGWTLDRPWLTIGSSAVLVVTMLWPLNRLGTEFMPEMDEGDFLYMPTTLPGISVGKARQLLQQTDRLIRTVPEVAQVFGQDITWTVEGRERYPVNLRYLQEWRDSITKLKELPLVVTEDTQVRLQDLAEVHVADGPPLIKSENGRIDGWVYVTTVTSQYLRALDQPAEQRPFGACCRCSRTRQISRCRSASHSRSLPDGALRNHPP